MFLKTNVSGVKQVIRKMRMQDRRFAKSVEVGLKRGGLFLQRESQKVVPVDYGPLKASAYTRAEGFGMKTRVHVGYTAAYALYVHEQTEEKLRGQPRNPSATKKGQKGYRGHFWDPSPQAGSKFLERPAREKKNEIGAIVRKSAAVHASLFASKLNIT